MQLHDFGKDQVYFLQHLLLIRKKNYIKSHIAIRVPRYTLVKCLNYIKIFLEQCLQYNWYNLFFSLSKNAQKEYLNTMLIF